jgi:hypothetical protein
LCFPEWNGFWSATRSIGTNVPSVIVYANWVARRAACASFGVRKPRATSCEHAAGR